MAENCKRTRRRGRERKKRVKKRKKITVPGEVHMMGLLQRDSKPAIITMFTKLKEIVSDKLKYENVVSSNREYQQRDQT